MCHLALGVSMPNALGMRALQGRRKRWEKCALNTIPCGGKHAQEAKFAKCGRCPRHHRFFKGGVANSLIWRSLKEALQNINRANNNQTTHTPRPPECPPAPPQPNKERIFFGRVCVFGGWKYGRMARDFLSPLGLRGVNAKRLQHAHLPHALGVTLGDRLQERVQRHQAQR